MSARADDTPTPAAPIPIILDCDPGHDDALAILLALARPELQVLGITTVGGNSTLENTTRNALSVLALLGRNDVPVAAGAAQPLTRQLQTAPHVHGSSGLEGADLPAPQSPPLAQDAIDFMGQTVADGKAPITLVATGPLTNVALFAARHPELFARLDSVCLMGGALGEGNITSKAEFNIWVDPEAAAAVFGAGRPVSMMGLDVTHQALVTMADTERLERLGTRTARAFGGLLRFFARFHAERYGWDGAPIHDAVAVAHLVRPSLVTTSPFRIVIATDEDERGRTIGTAALQDDRAAVQVGIGIDRQGFVSMLFDAVASFP